MAEVKQTAGDSTNAPDYTPTAVDSESRSSGRFSRIQLDVADYSTATDHAAAGISRM